MKIEEEIKQSKFNSAREKALINLMFTSNAVEDAFRKALKIYDISLPQYNVLRILRGRKDGYATCGDLKQVML
ncbi:MAG TPA: MarR family transcriptional regulator, partial [Bacteroidia bacterium]